MNNRIWQVFVYELRRNLRRKGFLFTTFGIPLLGYVLFFGYQFITSRNAAAGEDLAATITESDQFQGISKAGYVDHSGLFTSIPDELASVLSSYPDEQSAQAALDAGELDIYYVFPADYVETGDVTAYLPKFSIAKVDESIIQQLVYSQFAQGVNPDLINRLLNPVNLRRALALA
ncbi:MAG: hypothetical protein K8I82_04300, partial [Anaerolineae bacterium]|nr:hypothetical protein [Anaerolineae bacterium]